MAVAANARAQEPTDFRTTIGSRAYVEGRYVDTQLASILSTLDRLRRNCLASPACAASTQASELDKVLVQVQALRGQVGGVSTLPAGECLYQPRNGTRAEPMGTEAFAAFAKTIADSGSTSGKVDMIRMTARNNWFTAAQMAQLLAGFGFSPDRMKGLLHLAPKLVDPENALRLEDLFVTDSDKHRVRDELAEAATCPGMPYEERIKTIGRTPPMRRTATMPAYPAYTY